MGLRQLYFNKGIVRYMDGVYYLESKHLSLTMKDVLQDREAVKIGQHFDNPKWMAAEKQSSEPISGPNLDGRTISKLPYPLNLWSAVFRRVIGEGELPEKWAQVLDIVCGKLREEDPRYPEILLGYFKERKSYKELAARHGLSYQVVWNQMQHILRKLRDPRLFNYLLYGLPEQRKIDE